MGRLFVLGVAIAFGYSIGFRDARHHSENILARGVDEVRVIFGATPTNDVDAVMSKVEGKN